MNKFSALVLAVCALLWSTTVKAQTPFYKGKTITILVGTKAGDVYDLYPRMLSDYLTKYMPGNPNVIIQNVPGAASLIAANQVYNVAKPDGLTIAAIYPALYFEQLIKRPEVKFDWNKFGWIGSTVTSNYLMYMRSDTGYKTVEDVRKASTAPKCGATGVTSTGYYMPKLVEETTSAKFDIVSGYVSGQDIDLAVERGELQCRAFTITAYFAREPFISWRKKSFAHVLFQTGQKRDNRIPESPTIYEMMDKYKTPAAGRSLAKVVLASGEFGRPLVAPPGIPADRLEILRNAFNKSVNDPAIKSDAEKRRLELDPATGQELESLAKEVMSASPDVVQRVQKLLGK